MRLPAMQRLRGNRRMTVLIYFGEGIMQRTFFGRHYALAVVAIIFVALLAAAGLRSTPGVLMVPWEAAFGWSRQDISFAASTSTGTLIFIPALSAIAQDHGWQP